MKLQLINFVPGAKLIGCSSESQTIKTLKGFFIMPKSLARRLAAIPVFVLATAGAAHAALPADATAAIADMKTDGALLAGAFLVVCIAIAAVKILRKGT